jgi:purine-binding chemotaxis protein CheW
MPSHSPAAHKYTQPNLRVIVFKIAEHEYVIDVSLVQEIIRITDLAHVDGMPDYVEGVVKRRGRIVPIIDLRKRLELKISSATVETCAIVVNLSVGPVGFLVDAAFELTWVKTRDFEVPSPVLAGAGSKLHGPYFQGIAYLDGRSLVMLDLEHLLTASEQRELGKLEAWQPTAPQPEPVARPKFETLFSGEVDAEETEKEKAQQRARADLRRLLVFELSGELYSVSATAVAEIRELLPLMPLPNVPPHVLGLINLRGTVLPVLDLRRKFSFELQPGGPDNRLVILKGPGYSIALWVDSVYGLARLPRTAFQPAPPGVACIAPEYYNQIAIVDGRMLIELNIQEVLAGVTPEAAGTREGVPAR